MKPDVRKLLDDIFVAERKYSGLKTQLEAQRRVCQHKWGAVVYDPIVTQAYTLPGDPPGTMGVDRQLPCYVPRREEARWKRECSECGEVEYTFNTQDKVEKIPVF